MSYEDMLTKQNARQELRARLSAQDPTDRARRSLLIQRKLFYLETFRKARCVLFFASLPGEVDTASMIDAAIESGKRVLVPLTDLAARRLDLFEIRDRSELKKGATLGIPEPDPASARRASASEVEFAVVPGLGFDADRNRIGRGAGLYDRFLTSLAPGTPKVAIAFACQILPSVPVEEFDVKVDLILTEEGQV